MRLFFLTNVVVASLVSGSLAEAEAPQKLEVLFAEATVSNPIGLAAMELNRQHFVISAEQEQGVSVRRVDRSGLTLLSKIPCTALGGLEATSVRAEGRMALVALGNFFRRDSHAGLAIFDMKDPARPKLRGIWKSSQPMEGTAIVEVAGDTAILGGMSQGIIVLDISDPANIRHVTTFRPDPDFPNRNPNKIQMPNARGMTLVGKRLFVTYDAGGLRVIDLANPAKPREISRYINPKMKGRQQAYNNIVIHKHTAFIGVDYAGLEIVDIRDPENIKQIGWWNPWKAGTWQNLWVNSPGHGNEVHYDERERRVYLSAGDSEVQVLDVANPREPKLVQTLGEPKNKFGAWGISLSSKYMFVGYIKAIVPFKATWAGIRVVKR